MKHLHRFSVSSRSFIFSSILISNLIFNPVLTAQVKVPEWSKGIVWYQIFPERFSNGDSSNDPEAAQVFIDREAPSNWEVTPWTSNWFAQSAWEKALPGKFRDKVILRRYGGDIQGIIDRLDYIKELGVGAIYFNPIFESISMHKYDGSYYHHIDANYGPDPKGDRELMQKENPEDPSTWVWTSADKLFVRLIDEVHKRGMRIIIDGVFNHTGTEFWAFKDIRKNGKNSKYYDWYQIRSLDDPSTPEDEFDYKSWWNYKPMPEFNRTKNDLAAGPKKYIFNSTKRWMDPDGNGSRNDGVDGWRLDVARDVPLGFWRDWSRFVKSIYPDAYIVGELWEISSDFVGKGDAFDALMNYNFAFAVNDFFIASKKRISVSNFIKGLEAIDKSYPANTLHILQNLLDSHDTDRLVSMIINPDRDYDREGDERNPRYNPRKPEPFEYGYQKLVAVFQMTYRGAPMVYYGDEAGMWGADDPHDRKPMVWSGLKYDNETIDPSSEFKTGYGTYTVEVNQDMLDFYKKIIAVRNSSDAIRKGTLEFIYKNDEKSSFAFKRTFKKGNRTEVVVASFNIGNDNDSFELKNARDLTELLTGRKIAAENGKAIVQIPAKSAQVYSYIIE